MLSQRHDHIGLPGLAPLGNNGIRQPRRRLVGGRSSNSRIKSRPDGTGMHESRSKLLEKTAHGATRRLFIYLKLFTNGLKRVTGTS
jgi:hypothetical protein